MQNLLEAFSVWLSDTSLSRFIADRIWLIAIIQTIHILNIAVVMLGVTMINLRVLGIAGRSQSLSAMTHHFLPWIWVSLALLLTTGLILAIGEPGRNFQNSAFQIKMLLVLIGASITYYYGKALRRDAHYFDPGAGHRGTAILLASISLFCWVGIVVCGRLIAYMDLRFN